MIYDFDQVVERRGTDSIKWESYPEDVIPLWVADMDFRSAEPILRHFSVGLTTGSSGTLDLRRHSSEQSRNGCSVSTGGK